MQADKLKHVQKAERIVLIDGAPSAESQVAVLLEQTAQRLRQAGNAVDLFKLRDMKIGTCTGCWHCWTKTPGLCSQHDDIVDIYKAHAQADLVVFAAPLRRGFISALLKRYIDRIIPFGHPHVLLIGGECKHRQRYEQLPDFAVVLEPESDSDQEDMDCNFSYFTRTAEHFRTPLRCALQAEVGVEALVTALIGCDSPLNSPQFDPKVSKKMEENHAAMSD